MTAKPTRVSIRRNLVSTRISFSKSQNLVFPSCLLMFHLSFFLCSVPGNVATPHLRPQTDASALCHRQSAAALLSEAGTSTMLPFDNGFLCLALQNQRIARSGQYFRFLPFLPVTFSGAPTWISSVTNGSTHFFLTQHGYCRQRSGSDHPQAAAAAVLRNTSWHVTVKDGWNNPPLQERHVPAPGPSAGQSEHVAGPGSLRRAVQSECRREALEFLSGAE